MEPSCKGYPRLAVICFLLLFFLGTNSRKCRGLEELGTMGGRAERAAALAELLWSQDAKLREYLQDAKNRHDARSLLKDGKLTDSSLSFAKLVVRLDL
jgi:hypothetical protein